MKYIDLHTDALTKEGVLSVTKESLTAGGCYLECFACFTPRGRLEKTLKLCDKFEKMCLSDGYRWVKGTADLDGEGIHAMLTVEGGEAIEGDLKNLHVLHEKGIRMLTLVWNYDNEIGSTHGGSPPPYPPSRGGGMNEDVPQGGGQSSPLGGSCHAVTEEGKGLTPFGRDVVEKMGELKMLVDVSHGSDALFFDVAQWSRRSGIPFVASHSNARAVHAHTRNLSDAEIRTLADCGGVMGLNFYDEFLSPDKSAAGQKSALIAQITHSLKVGGEDVLALGSDFDGIPQNAYMKTAADMPQFLEDLCEVFPPRLVEKLAFRNAERVIRTVLCLPLGGKVARRSRDG